MVEDSTGGDSGSGDTTCTHVDSDSNGLCDSCGEAVESGSGDESTTTYAATFADNSWADIAAACQNNDVPDTWNVGDTKTMTINGAECNVTIIGRNHDTYADGSGLAPLTFQTDIVGTGAMNSEKTSAGGWSGSNMYRYLNNTLIATMEDDIANNIKSVIKYSNNGLADAVSTSNIQAVTSNDKLFLLSIIEVLGEQTSENANLGGTQYAYYANGGSIKKQYNGSNTYWWLREPSYKKTNYFMYISASGECGEDNPTNSYGRITFGFCF